MDTGLSLGRARIESEMVAMNLRPWSCAVLAAGLVYACGSDDDETPGTGTGGQPSTGGASANGGAATGGAPEAGGGPSATGGATAATRGATAAGGTPADFPTSPPDPSAATIDIPGIACDSPLDANLQTPFATIGGRRVFVDYACNKPKGTKVTFILNLHGTMGDEGAKHYIRSYWPSFKYAASHDFIIATPKAIGSQWGNGDGGKDAPHIAAVVEWMYKYFAGFDIAQMWVVGHSWGSAYTLGYACNPAIEDKIKGVVLMSGGPTMPACADRLSVIGTVGELDIVPGQPTQAATATAHDCDAESTHDVGNNVVTEWASCDPGWVHRNYFMNGKAHGFVPADWPETLMNDDIANAVKSTR
jgi:hypothetical protein